MRKYSSSTTCGRSWADALRWPIYALLLLLATIVRADCTGTTTGSMGAVAASDCTGTVIFSAHFENSTSNTTGTPAGCPTATGTLNSAAVFDATVAHDGTYSLNCPTSTDYESFTVTAGDIFNSSAGTVDFWLYMDNIVTGQYLFDARQDSTNRFQIFVTNTDEVKVRWSRTGETDIDAVTTAANMANGNWYHIVATYTTSDVNPNFQIGVYNASDVLISAAVSNTNPVALATGVTVIRIGEDGGVTNSAFHIDQLHIHSDVQ